MKIISTYTFLLICLSSLLGIKFQYVEIESYSYIGLNIRFLDPLITDAPLYLLICISLFITIGLYYFSRNLLYSLFFCASLTTLAISIPLGHLGLTYQNLIIAGYLVVSLLLVHIIIAKIFLMEYFILDKEQAKVLQINRFTYYAFRRLKEATFYAFFSSLIILVCFIYGEYKTNLHGILIIFVSIFIGVAMQLYIRSKSKEKIKSMQEKVYEAELSFYMRNKKSVKKMEKDTKNDSSDFSLSRKRQNAISNNLSEKYKEYVDLSVDENMSTLGIDINIEKKQINFTLKNHIDKIKVRNNFLLFPYWLPFHIMKKINSNNLTSNDLLSIFQYVVDKDILTKIKLEDAISEVKDNYVGIVVYPILDSHNNLSINSIYKNYLDVGVYASLEYSLPLSKINEYASRFYTEHPELDMTEKNQSTAMLHYAIQNVLGEISMQEKDRVCGYKLAKIAVNIGSLNKLKTAIEIDLVDVNSKEEGTEWSLLNLSVANGHYELAKYLLDNRADPNIPNHLGRYPIHFASNYDSTAFVELLLEYGANIEEKDDLGYTSLLRAIIKKNKKTVKFLLDRNANINALDCKGVPAIQIARDIDIDILRMITQSKQYNINT